MFFPILAPDGAEVLPIHDYGREACWALGRSEIFRPLSAGEIVWKQREKDGRKVWVPYTREFAPESPARPWQSIWSDLDTTRQTKAHHRKFFGTELKTFETPKPEDLIGRALSVCSEPEDWILDSFAGSGTTGAAAHKMRRRWIIVELGEHCHTHIIPRVKKVIDGADPGGVRRQ